MAKPAMQTKPAGTAVEKTRPGALSEPVPDFMKHDAGKGLENVETGDYEMPRIKLIQALSEEVQTHDVRPGNFFHTIAEIDLGPAIDIVPLFYAKSYILWNPRDSGGGILARAVDGVHWTPPDVAFDVKLDAKQGGKTVRWRTAKTVQASGLAEWGTTDPSDPKSQPAATFMINFVCALPDHIEYSPALITFQRSSVGVGKKFLSNLLLASGRMPIFGRRFTLSSFDDSNANNQKFKNFRYSNPRLIADAAEYESYKGLATVFAHKGIRDKDLTGLQDEDAGAGHSGEAAPEPAGTPAY